MDLETCSAFCYALGALYFGVEYGGEVCILLSSTYDRANIVSVIAVMSWRRAAFLPPTAV